MFMQNFCWKLCICLAICGKKDQQRPTPFPYITLPYGATFPTTRPSTGSTIIISTSRPTVPTTSIRTTRTTVRTLPTTVSTPRTVPTIPTVRTTVSTVRTVPTLPTTVSTSRTVPTISTLPTTVRTVPTSPTFPTFPTLPTTVRTVPTVSTSTARPTVPIQTQTTTIRTTASQLNCPNGLVLCPNLLPPETGLSFGSIVPPTVRQRVIRQGTLPSGCPCIDPRGSALDLLLSALANTCLTPDNRQGYCVNIGQCTYFRQLIREALTGQLNMYIIGAYIRQSMCGYDGLELICCPSTSYLSSNLFTYDQQSIFIFNQLSPPSTTTIESFEFSTDATVPIPPSTTSIPLTTLPVSIPSVVMSNQLCGISNFTQTRVVGGGPAKLGQYPWIAALTYKVSGDRVTYNCGGSLISIRHVITTAHCVTDELFSVRLGEYNIQSDSDGAMPIDVLIDQWFIHEGYDSKLILNDIAILKLNRDVVITDMIRPICLPINESLRNRDLTGYTPFIAGWGAQSFQGPASPVLQEAQIMIISTAACEQNYRKYFPNQIFDERVLCAGYGIRDSCQGDSGGPLMLPQTTSDFSYYYVLIGLVSYGFECSREGFPGVYTRVSYYIPWIFQNLYN